MCVDVTVQFSIFEKGNYSANPKIPHIVESLPPLLMERAGERRI